MSVKRNDGGSAFPVPEIDGMHGAYPVREPGMSLRDYFAAQAMIGIMSTAGGFDRADRRHSMVADQAYQFADAMLAERDK